MKTSNPVPASGLRVQGFAPVPNWLLRRREVNDGAKLVFGRLCQYCGGESACFPKQATLAGELGKSERTIRDHLAELEEHGLIRRIQRGFARSNLYELLAHPWHLESETDGGSAPSATPEESPSLEAKSCRSGPADSCRRDRRDSAGPVDEETTGKNTEEKRHTHAGSAFVFVPPSLAEAKDLGDREGLPPDAVAKWHAENEAIGWVNKHGQPVRDWRASLRAYGVSWRAVEHRAQSSARTSSPKPRRSAESHLLAETIEPKILQL